MDDNDKSATDLSFITFFINVRLAQLLLLAMVMVVISDVQLGKVIGQLKVVAVVVPFGFSIHFVSVRGVVPST